MTAQAARLSRAAGLVRLVRDLAVGTLLCLTVVGAVVALGWIARRTGGDSAPGWILGTRGRGLWARALGGLAANIAVGMRMLTGQALWTLPFASLLLGGWWWGWDNSFHKGYEQAAIGPLVFALGWLLAIPALTLLPFAVVRAARTGRLGAFLDVAPIVDDARAAGWRGTALAVASVLAAVPLFGLRGLPVFIESLVPDFADLPAAAQADIAGIFALAGAAWAFAAVYALRLMAAGASGRAGPRTRLGRAVAWMWLALAAAVWALLPALVAMGQFLNHAPALWLTHPLWLLPWAG